MCICVLVKQAWVSGLNFANCSVCSLASHSPQHPQPLSHQHSCTYIHQSYRSKLSLMTQYCSKYAGASEVRAAAVNGLRSLRQRNFLHWPLETWLCWQPTGGAHHSFALMLLLVNTISRRCSDLPFTRSDFSRAHIHASPLDVPPQFSGLPTHYCGRIRLKRWCRCRLQVPDPYYGGADGFERVLDLLEDACTGLLDRVRRDHGGLQ